MYVDLNEWLARVPLDRLFMRTLDGGEWTYADLLDESRMYAPALHNLGVVPGARLAVRVEKSPSAVLLYVACLQMGTVFVPINTAYSPAEVEYFLSDSKPIVAVVDPADVPVLEPLRLVDHLLTLDASGRGSLSDIAW